MTKLIITQIEDDVEVTYSKTFDDLMPAGDFFEAVLDAYVTLGFVTDVEISVGNPDTGYSMEKLSYSMANYIQRTSDIE